MQKEQKYVIIGVCKAHYPEEDDFEKQVASFSSRRKAEEYIQWAKLSTYSTFCCRGQHFKQFRKKSLLRQYCEAHIDIYEPPEELPVDPEHK